MFVVTGGVVYGALKFWIRCRTELEITVIFSLSSGSTTLRSGGWVKYGCDGAIFLIVFGSGGASRLIALFDNLAVDSIASLIASPAWMYGNVGFGLFKTASISSAACFR